MIETLESQLDVEEVEDAEEELESSSSSSSSSNSSVRFFRSASSSSTSSTRSSVKLLLIFVMSSTMQLSSENSECVQPLLVSVSESSSMSDSKSSTDCSTLSRSSMIGPLSSLSSSIQAWMIGKMVLS